MGWLFKRRLFFYRVVGLFCCDNLYSLQTAMHTQYRATDSEVRKLHQALHMRWLLRMAFN